MGTKLCIEVKFVRLKIVRKEQLWKVKGERKYADGPAAQPKLLISRYPKFKINFCKPVC